MSLAAKDSPCAICKQPLGDAEFLGFSFLEIAHKDFEVFNDSNAHQVCLRKWERKEEFVKFWNSAIRRSHDMFERDYELLAIQPDGSVIYQKPETEVKKHSSLFKRLFGKA